MVFLMTSAKGTLWHYDVLFDWLHRPGHVSLLNFWQFGSFYLSLKFFCPVRIHAVSSHTPITSHLHWRWNRKTASFRFSWAMTKTCYPLSGVPLAFLPSGFLMTLQKASTFLSVRTLNLSGLSSSLSLMSNLAASALNPSWMYIS